MGNWRTGGRWSDVEGGTWIKESWGAKKCDGNERLGIGSGRRVKGMMRCGMQLRRDAGRMQGGMWSEARARCGAKHGVGGGEEDNAVRGGVGRGKNGVRNHFGRHFTNIVYIIKKMF